MIEAWIQHHVFEFHNSVCLDRQSMERRIDGREGFLKDANERLLLTMAAAILKDGSSVEEIPTIGESVTIERRVCIILENR